MHLRRVRLCLLGLTLIAAPAAAQLPETPKFPPPPVTMGQPERIRITWGELNGYHYGRDGYSGRFFANITSRGFRPEFGIGSVTTEFAAGAVGKDFDSAVGAYVKIPWVRVGAEYSFLEEKVLPSLFTEWAITRGGLFNHGDELRIDVRPWDKQWRVGFTFNNPFERYRLTRPTHNYVTLPKDDIPKTRGDPFSGLTPADRQDIEDALQQVEHAMVWMDRLLTPHFKTGSDFAESAFDYRVHISQPGHTFYDEDECYHRELSRAFGIAVGAGGSMPAADELGEEMAARAESIIYHDIVVPWNRVFGQNKDPHHPKGLIAQAMKLFDAEIFNRAPLQRSPERAAAVREVFARTTSVINDVAIDSRNRWQQAHLVWLRQSRLVWLPINYGLRREQYDTQMEKDAALSDLTGETFTDANSVELLLNEQFHVRLKQMIRETRAYHVFIIHDFRGRTRPGHTDSIGWNVVVDGYIRAFETAIRELDSGERDRLPQFMLFLDEVFYQDNRSREIITFLENLYDGSHLDLKDKAVQERVMAAHASLRKTIASSRTLAGFGDDVLRKLIRLNVNITNPFDPSFADDSPLRDHRKIAFRDVFEGDPALGAAIFTGQGAGEHYNGPSWEDRSLLVRGPALRALKFQTRRLFLSQGFSSDEVPFFLRQRPVATDDAARCAELKERGWDTPLMMVMNDTGFGWKKATILKAALYNLSGPGDLMAALDSLWISEFWAGMFVAAAVRGTHAYPVGPAADNAPSSAGATMFLMRENLEMMLKARDYFQEPMLRSGGALHVGLYATDIPVQDGPRRLGAFLEGLDRYPFLANEFALDPGVMAYLRDADARHGELFPPLQPDRSGVPSLTSDHDPFIHLKAQFFAGGTARSVLSCPEWKPVFAEYLSIRHRQVLGLPSPGITPQVFDSAPDVSTGGLYAAFDRALKRAVQDGGEPATFTFTIGSQNQDRRGMLLDGEVLVAVSGYDATIAVPDLLMLLGMSYWPEHIDDLRSEFPVDAPGIFRRVFIAIKDLI